MQYVTVECHYNGKRYEYKTDLLLGLGRAYKIKVDTGWNPPMRVKVVALSTEKLGNYVGTTDVITEAVEVETF